MKSRTSSGFFAATLKVLFAALIIIPLVIGVAYVGSGGESFGIATQSRDFSTATSSKYLIPSTPGGDAPTILESNLARAYAAISNHCSSPIYLFMATTSSHAANYQTAVERGIYVAASGGKYEINADNPYLGSLTASSTASCEISVLENL